MIGAVTIAATTPNVEQLLREGRLARVVLDVVQSGRDLPKRILGREILKVRHRQSDVGKTLFDQA
ncbi:MAG: hypothetical protein WD066_04945 [Planctomycetaceae bacterium]